MATIGNWGSSIKFQTSSSKILTFRNFKRKVMARTSKHEMIGGQTKVEFHGTDLQAITFTVEVNALLGVKPRTVEKKLLGALRSGTVAPLVIGGRVICGKAMLTGVSAAYNEVLQKGEVLSMSLDLTMTEYN